MVRGVFDRAKDMVANHAMTAIFAIATGYLFGTNESATIKADLASAQKDIAKARAVQIGRTEFMVCATRQIDWIKAGGHGVEPCALTVPE